MSAAVTVATNKAFLSAVFGHTDPADHIAYTNFSVSPDLATGKQWKAKLAPPGQAPTNLLKRTNNYFSTAVVGADRNADSFIRLAAMVLDDLKGDALPLPPSYRLETSAGNFQYGYIIVDSAESRDVGYCKRAVKALIAANLIADKSGNNPVRWVRCLGSNTKTDNIDANGKPFLCVLRELEPTRRYTIKQVLDAYGVVMSAAAATKLNGKAPHAPDLQTQIHTLATAGPGLHDAQVSVSMQWVLSGMDPAYGKRLMLAVMCNDGTERVEGRIADIDRMFDSAVDKRNADIVAREIEPMDTGDASMLLKREFQPIAWVIDQILPPGIFILAAAPKVGKSWLVMQAGLAIASGGHFLGFQCVQGDVLYLALEDNDRRMQKRLRAQGADALDAESLQRFHYKTQWPRLDEGGAKALDEWIAAHAATRFIAIDLLENFRAPRKAKAEPYAQDYEALAAVRELTRKYPAIAFEFVHHTRKMNAADPLDEISGTQGIAGSADGVLILKRPRGNSRGELHVIGRDIEHDGAYAVDFNKATAKWEMVGEASKVETSAGRALVLRALEALGGAASLSDVVLQTTGKSKQYVFQMLGELVERGLVTKPAKGRYEISPTELYK
jgi:AAA domain